MSVAFLYALLSVLIVSLVSFSGAFALALNDKKLKKILLYLVSFSAGALLGDAFFHLLPETVASLGFGVEVSFYVLLGIVFSFVIETFIHWRHCHIPTTKEHVHAFAYMNLLGDGVHNLIDGLIIGASYLVSIPLGVATTVAVVFHEIPQEMGDFAVLIQGGFAKEKALFFNFLTSLTSLLGLFLAFFLARYVEGVTLFLVPFAAGGFIYIACSDLIPELHRVKSETQKAIFQLVFFLLGIFMLYLLLALG